MIIPSVMWRTEPKGVKSLTIWIVTDTRNNFTREGNKYNFFLFCIWKIRRGSVLCYTRWKNRNQFMVTPSPVQGIWSFQTVLYKLMKNDKNKNLNYFYIIAKIYSNEPKINHHSLWTGIGQHLRTPQTSFSLCAIKIKIQIHHRG